VKLLFLYGPPAVGKLTVAKILAERTGYRLLHNHLLVNPIAEVFPFENPANRMLVREFRLRILEEAVKSNINLIATFGIAGNDPFSHITDVLRMIASHQGNVCLVHLTANQETILHRVTEQSRREHGKQLSREKLQLLIEENKNLFYKYPDMEHISVDTTAFSAERSAEEIISYYKL
jgi:shikimate kinase